MAKNKYHFNPQTLSMEPERRTPLYWLKQTGTYIIGGVLIGILLLFVFFSFFPSPREKQLRRQKEALESQYVLLTKQVDQMQLVLADLQQRDENLYRVLFQADPVKRDGYNSNYRVAYYDSLADMTNYQLASTLTRKTDILERQLYLQAQSYTEIVGFAKDRTTRLENIPAIQPVLNKDLKRMASGYGWRNDPIYHTRRFHAGMDFTAPVGTDVYATGNAKVVFTGWKQGYGNCVIIDHGYNYQTLYAHLSRSLVRKGQKVKRGDVIALVGNTGKSTGPHLHYEVHYKNKPVDPRNFYFLDLSPEEYDQMVQLANNQGNLLD